MEELRLPGMLVRFRPVGPWRIGPDSGARDRVDHILHSDVLYSAVCSAMNQLGQLPEWLAATAGASTEPAVLFSSCFPWQEDELFVVPPRNLWPPPPSAKVRWKGARFIPLSLVSLLLSEKPVDEERWAVDPVSDCLLPAQRRFAGGPFRVAVRSSAAVDRLSPGLNDVHATACLEFADRAGMWCAIAFAGDEARTRWSGPVKSALRLLADSGLGGERSRGWGRSLSPSIIEGDIPALLLPKLTPKRTTTTEVESSQPAEPTPVPEAALELPAAPEIEPIPAPEAAVEPPAAPEIEPTPAPEAALEPPAAPEIERTPAPEAQVEGPAVEVPLRLESEPEPARPLDAPVTPVRPQPAETAGPAATAWWLLSLYSPSPADPVDWSRGNYTTLTRTGRIESSARWGELKKSLRMVGEGSVILAPSRPRGDAPDVAPDGFPHPVFRSGFAFAVPIPWRISQ